MGDMPSSLMLVNRMSSRKIASIIPPPFGESSAIYDGYYVAYKPITLSCISFMFIKMKFIHCHSCLMFVAKSMSMCND